MRTGVEVASLGHQIERKMAHSMWPDKRTPFLPIDTLNKFVDRGIVQQELNAVDLGTENKLSIQREHASLSDRIMESRRKIFVILAVMDELPTILALIDEDIQDSDLPFLLNTDKDTEHHLYRYVGDKLERIKSFDDLAKWSATKRLGFYQCYQWQVLSPCFSLSSKTQPYVSHENLEHDRIILPFVEESMPEDTVTGGSCEVRRVKIHIAHQNRHLAHVGSS
jgi:hypothetical protein